jgi:hypothetical protein
MKRETPVWETAIMVGSFVLLWAWFIAYKGSLRTNVPLPLWWHFFLLAAVGLLIFVMVRRINRLKEALRGGDNDGQPIYPMFGGPPDRRP